VTNGQQAAPRHKGGSFIMYPSDITGELSRQRIADLHVQADRQRQVRSLPSRAAALRQLAATVVLAAVPVAVLLLETAGTRIP
jgi:hypothetical protein